MSRLYRFCLVPEVEVRLSSSAVRPTPPELRKRVDGLWEAGQQSRWLFDGLCFSVTSISASLIKGELVSYRAWYASTQDRSLAKKLAIFPLAVSGHTMNGNRVLVGRRSPRLASYAGWYECVPSGTFSDATCSIAKLITTELEEEAGLSSSISSIQPLALYWSPEDNSWDIHVDIFVDKAPQQITSPSGEYDRLFWADPSENFEGEWVPLSKEFLRIRS